MSTVAWILVGIGVVALLPVYVYFLSKWAEVGRLAGVRSFMRLKRDRGENKDGTGF